MTRGLTRNPSDKRGTDTRIKKAGFFYLIYRTRKGTRTAVHFGFCTHTDSRALSLVSSIICGKKQKRSRSRELVAQGPEGRLRSLVESNYTQRSVAREGHRHEARGALRCVCHGEPVGAPENTRENQVRSDDGRGVSWATCHRTAQERRLHREWFFVPAPLKQKGPVFCFVVPCSPVDKTD
jgi:hypothetical protein